MPRSSATSLRLTSIRNGSTPTYRTDRRVADNKGVGMKDRDNDVRDEGDAPAAARKHLVLRIRPAEYGIDLLAAREIRRYGTVTPIANVPAYIKGSINLRGTLLTILDLRLWPGIDDATFNDTTAVIILDAEGQIADFVVDSAADVLKVHAVQINPIPPRGQSSTSAHIAGSASNGCAYYSQPARCSPHSTTAVAAKPSREALKTLFPSFERQLESRPFTCPPVLPVSS